MENKQLNDFTKGLISRISDDKIADNSFSDCMNIDLSNKYLPQSVKGKIKVNDIEIDSSSCMGMTIYNNKENGAYIVVACGGYLWYSPLNTDNFQKYKIDNNGVLEDVLIDPNVRVRFAQYNDRLFVFTGKYPVIENLSFNTACILVIYKTTATYIDRTSFYAWNKDNNGGIFYTLSDTPTSGDIIFTDLYRTKLDNVTISSYDSANNKFTDSANVDYFRTTDSDKIDPNVPKGIKYPIIHQERLFGFGSIEDDNGIYWSQPYEPTKWTPDYGLNYDTVGKDDGEQITGGASFGGIYIYIFKQHNVYRYITSGDIDNWSSNKVDTNYGCVAHETIKLFQGVLTYLSPDGVAQLNGNSAVLIDEQIKNKTTNVSIGSSTEIERSYTKNSNWNATLSVFDGVSIQDNKLVNVNDTVFGNDDVNNINGLSFKNNISNNFGITNNSLFTDMRDELIEAVSRPSFQGDFRIVGTKNVGTLTNFLNQGCLFPVNLLQGTKIQNLRVYILGIASSYLSNGKIWIELYSYTFGGGLTKIGTSEKINVSSINNNSWQTFNFSNNIDINNTATYYFRVNGSADFSNNMTGYLNVFLGIHNGHSYVIWQEEDLAGTITTTFDDPNYEVAYIINYDINYSWVSNEIDTQAQDKWTIKNLVLGKLNSYGSNTFSYKIMIGHYDVAETDWDNITDIITVDIDELSFPDSYLEYLVNDSNIKRYFKIKIVSVSGIWGLRFVHLQTRDINKYESEPIVISGSNPNAWGIAEIDRTGSDDISNKASVYMRTGATTTELESATYYQINNYEQIVGCDLKIYVQFKVEFPRNSDNKISSIKIIYYTKESITRVCSIVWKDKYRINMPKDNSSNTNFVEYVYDKNGYWIIKDNENNFDYCSTLNDLFAVSGEDGFVYKKEVGYTNAGQSYNSYFVTKKFVMSDFENLFRNFKLRFVSNIDITVGVSVDDGEWVNYTISNSSKLVEILRSLTGIVRGQTIKFKFSWTANESTEIHNFVFYWNILRQLNV